MVKKIFLALALVELLIVETWSWDFRLAILIQNVNL
jgi:hypothetical protein